MTTRRFSSALLATGLLAAVLAASAWAAGNVIRISTPRHATANHNYSIGFRGHANTTEHLYMFVDAHACGANPAIEHARANGDIWTVKGNFHVVAKGWHGPASKQHVCAYLVKFSEPENSPNGVLAHRFKGFIVH